VDIVARTFGLKIHTHTGLGRVWLGTVGTQM